MLSRGLLLVLAAVTLIDHTTFAQVTCAFKCDLTTMNIICESHPKCSLSHSEVFSVLNNDDYADLAECLTSEGVELTFADDEFNALWSALQQPCGDESEDVEQTEGADGTEAQEWDFLDHWEGWGETWGTQHPWPWGDFAEAALGAYPGQADAGVTGVVKVTACADSLTITGKLSGLPFNTVGAIHLHSGYSCDTNDEVGAHWFNADRADPWSTFYSSDAKGVAELYIVMTADELGFDVLYSLTHTVVVHDLNGKIACGVLGDNFAEAALGVYPGQADAGVTGVVKVTAYADSLTITGKLSGLPFNTVGAIHLHSGYSCDTDDEVGAHWFNADRADPWTTFYSSDALGVAELYIVMTADELGFDVLYSLTHTVVVHDLKGKIACGVLGGEEVEDAEKAEESGQTEDKPEGVESEEVETVESEEDGDDEDGEDDEDDDEDDDDGDEDDEDDDDDDDEDADEGAEDETQEGDEVRETVEPEDAEDETEGVNIHAEYSFYGGSSLDLDGLVSHLVEMFEGMVTEGSMGNDVHVYVEVFFAGSDRAERRLLARSLLQEEGELIVEVSLTGVPEEDAQEVTDALVECTEISEDTGTSLIATVLAEGDSTGSLVDYDLDVELLTSEEDMIEQTSSEPDITMSAASQARTTSGVVFASALLGLVFVVAA